MDLVEFVGGDLWRVDYRAAVIASGIPFEIVIVKKQ